MPPRRIAIATVFMHAAAIGHLLAFTTTASADAIADKALPSTQTAVAAPAVTETAAAMPVVAAPAALPATALPTTTLPAAAPPAVAVPPATEPTAQPPEARQRGDRTKIFSYILLRGLQDAGPFAGR